MSGSRTDRIYRSILLNKFFTKGWGKPENLRRLFQFRKIISNREKCMQLVDKEHPVTITKEERHRDHTLIEGRFQTPFMLHCPDLLPREAETAHFQALLPARWTSHLRPTVLHLAGTGDHYFWKRRTLLARPLLKENGIGSIILENPFYGLRKPPDQVRSSLRNVSDLFVMGGCLILESMALLHWAQRRGLGPLGITGISMGGHMASLAASVWDAPLVLVPCLSWTSASAVFTSGVLSQAINWELLEQQYVSDNVYRNELKTMVKILHVSELDRTPSGTTGDTSAIPATDGSATTEGDHFHAGRQFARSYPQEIVHMQRVADRLVSEHQSVEQQRATSPGAILPDAATSVSVAKETDALHAGATHANADPREALHRGSSRAEAPVEIPPRSVSEASDNSDMPRSGYVVSAPTVMAATVGSPPATATFRSASVPTLAAADGVASQASRTGVAPHQRIRSGVPVATSPHTSMARSKAQLVRPAGDSSAGAPASPPAGAAPTRSLFEVVANIARPSANKPLSSMARSKSLLVRPAAEKVAPQSRPATMIEAFNFMRGIMDECTHLANFPVPVDPTLVLIVQARDDAYVPREGLTSLTELWPGSSVRFLDTGHVAAYLFNQDAFRVAIADAFDKMILKYNL